MHSCCLRASSCEKASPIFISAGGMSYVSSPPFSEMSVEEGNMPCTNALMSSTSCSCLPPISATDSLTTSSKPDPNLFLRCCLVPRARSCPLTMMPMRLHRASASSMLCVVRMTALWLMVRRITDQRLRLLTGSSPAEGSSSSTTSGSPMSAMATQSLRFMPPDRRMASLWRCGVSSSWSMVPSTTCLTRSSGTPLSLAKSFRCASTESRSHRELFCVTTPRCVAPALKSLRIEWLATKASPLVGTRCLVSMDSTVVLPAPFAPSSPKISPEPTLKATSCAATTEG
mmetsp:Transcript_1837/g.4273  ORF Transcript_1837/g.4273 Transcript_1837/m.4273 type:complete len:286 (-) Transcript_1837:1559-2416(-)